MKRVMIVCSAIVLATLLNGCTGVTSARMNAVATNTTSASPAIAPAPGTTWYIRNDGGSRYSSVQPTGRCDGKHDAADPGSGTNQPCAFGDVRYLWSDGSAAGSWAISGGDTVIIRGGPWRVGAINSSGNAFNGYTGIQGSAYSMSNPTIPAGTSGQHTRILGENYVNCSAASAKTQLFGGFAVFYTFDLGATSFVDFQCIELTDHTNCQSNRIASPVTHTCRNVSPYDDWSPTGLHVDANTHDVLLQDLNIHGFETSGMTGPIGANLTMTRVRIAFNEFAGWNLDNGAGYPGNKNGTNSSITGTYSTFEWNGCDEEYPIVDAVPAMACYDTSSGGFGDSFSGQTALLSAMTWDHGIIRYNTKDGFIGPHQYIGSLTITNSIWYGNMGQIMKWAGGLNGTAMIQNNLVVSNCRRLAAAVAGAPAGFNTNLSAFCRADGAAWSHNWPVNGSIEFDNNTFVNASQNSGFDLNCSQKVTSATISAGGTGYQVNDVLQLGGDFTAATLTVTSVSSGVITGLSITTAGAWFENIGNPATLYGGHGTGATATHSESSNTCNGGNRILRNNIFLGYTDSLNPLWNGSTVGFICYTACSGGPGTVDDTMWTTRTDNIFYGFKTGTFACTYGGESCTDPLLVNEPSQTWTSETQLDNFNFNLTSGSPAKNTGVAINGLTTDYNSAAWHNPPSLGALE